MSIWVLTCDGIPHAWNEDVFVLIKNMQKSFPEKKWEQINDLVWQMTNGDWRITNINKMNK